jgi:hypothetical protein
MAAAGAQLVLRCALRPAPRGAGAPDASLRRASFQF